jgi:hypothetical protein
MNTTSGVVIRVLTGIGALVAVAMVATTAAAQTNRLDQFADRFDLYVDDPRPVAKAIELLTERYSQVITYEDPRYEYEGDIRDVTLEVRRDLDRYPPGQAPKVLVPISGSLDITQPLSPNTGEPENWVSTLRLVVDSHQSGAAGGRFRVERVGAVLHVIPTETRDSHGEWIKQASILDVTISITPQELSGSEILEAICNAVSKATGLDVRSGARPTNMFLDYRGQLEADNETARSVLTRALQSINNRLTWQIFYAPDSKRYLVHIRRVMAPPIPTSETPSQQLPPPPRGESPTRGRPRFLPDQSAQPE